MSVCICVLQTPDLQTTDWVQVCLSVQCRGTYSSTPGLGRQERTSGCIPWQPAVSRWILSSRSNGRLLARLLASNLMLNYFLFCFLDDWRETCISSRDEFPQSCRLYCLVSFLREKKLYQNKIYHIVAAVPKASPICGLHSISTMSFIMEQEESTLDTAVARCHMTPLTLIYFIIANSYIAR